MSKEIEKKYLVKKEILKVLKENNIDFSKLKMKQYYTKVEPYSEERVRSINNKKFILTTKKGTGSVREEFEKEISKEEFLEKKREIRGNIISKDCYVFKIDGFEYSLYIYKKSLKPLTILEIEFPTTEEFNSYRVPTFLKKYIIKDVTIDERYKNRNLALFNRPLNDEKEVYPNSTTKEALKIELIKLIDIIESYKNRILKENDNENLHQFRVNIRKIRAILSQFGHFFDKCLIKVLKDRFKKIVKKTNYKRDLDVFYDNLKEDNSQIIRDFLKHLERKQKREEKKIKEFLNSILYQSYIKEARYLIKSEVAFVEEAERVLISFSLQKINQEREKEIIKDLENIDENTPIEKLHKIRIKFKKFRYLIEIFEKLYSKNENIKEFLKKLKWFQNNLGYLNDCTTEIRIIEEFLNKGCPKLLKEELERKLENLHLLESKLRKKIIKKSKKGLIFENSLS